MTRRHSKIQSLGKLAQLVDFSTHEKSPRELSIVAVEIGKLAEPELAEKLPCRQNQNRIEIDTNVHPLASGVHDLLQSFYF